METRIVPGRSGLKDSSPLWYHLLNDSPHVYFGVQAQQCLPLTETISRKLPGQLWGQRWHLHIAIYIAQDNWFYENKPPYYKLTQAMASINYILNILSEQSLDYKVNLPPRKKNEFFVISSSPWFSLKVHISSQSTLFRKLHLCIF
jgi:hypothetical protein